MVNELQQIKKNFEGATFQVTFLPVKNKKELKRAGSENPLQKTSSLLLLTTAIIYTRKIKSVTQLLVGQGIGEFGYVSVNTTQKLNSL